MRFSSNVRTLWCGLASVALLTLAACSDGQLSNPPVTLDESPLVPVLINSFTVADASDANAKADKTSTIEAGGSVMVSWDVTGAKSLEITYSKGKNLANVNGLVGKAQSDPLMSDEALTLTAEGSDGVKAQATVTITIRKKEIKINSFKADPEKINAGESTKLCWSISDSTAKVSVKAGDEEIYPGNTVPEVAPVDQPSDVTVTTVSKAMRFLLKSGDTPEAPHADSEEPPVEASVCPVTHSPAQTTTYTLSVMDGDTVAATQDVTVTVLSAPANIAAFVAQPAQLSGPGEVTLTWRVTPSDVTVSIDHGVTTADKAEGEKTVHVTETTTFTLTATTKDGQIQTKTVTVTLPSAADLRVEAKTLTPSIFAGETAKIAITHGNASGKVSVVDAFGRIPAFTVSASVVSISNAAAGNNSYTLDIDGERSNPLMVEVRGLSLKDSGNWKGIGLNGLALGVIGTGNTTVKEANKTVQLGMARLLDELNIASRPTVDFGAMFGAATHFHGDYISQTFGPYAINAIVFDSQKSGRAYAAVSGGVLYSNNNGSSWDVVDLTPLYDSGKYRDTAESHASCGGAIRNGTKSAGQNWLVDIVDVCDLALDYDVSGKNDRLLIATDYGVVYIDGVQGRIDNKSDATHAMQGRTKDNVLFGKVVNKLAIAKAGDQTIVVAATDSGVYINAKRGDYKSWQQIDKAGLKDAVNTVAISGNTIYAGTNKGLFKSNGLDASSTFTQVSISADPMAVKALAVDAADSATIYVGTAKGLKLSRDCAGSFTDVTVDVGEVRNIATSADSGRSAIVLTSDKGLFTSVGVANASGSCAPSTTASQPTTGSEPPVTSQRPTSTGPGTVVPN